MRNLDHKSFAFSIHLSAHPRRQGPSPRFALSALAYLNLACAAAGGAGTGSDKVCGWFNTSRAPQYSTAATADPSWSISVQGLQIVTVPAPSPSAEPHQPQTRGSWQCLKFIIFSHGKQLTCKPTYRAWACCCCCSTWMLNWAFNWFPQPVFQV